MPTRDEIARVTLEYVTGKSWDTGKINSATDSIRDAHRELADAILALDWIGPGLRDADQRAREIAYAGHREIRFNSDRDDLASDIAAALRQARAEGLEEAAAIVQLAREGEIDGDFRSIISRIRALKDKDPT